MCSFEVRRASSHCSPVSLCRAVGMTLALCAGWFTGCAAITNPVANGIPVRQAPPALLASPPREAMVTIPLTLLGQQEPEVYELGAGDVLGIYVEGILPATPRDAPPANPPVYFPSQIDPLGSGLPPAMGFPIPIGDDGTISLPHVKEIRVEGMDATKAADVINRAYVDAGILQPGRRVLVTLMQPRKVRVVVIREETGGFARGGRGDIAVSNNKRGNGGVLDLRVYENDVLHAIAESGGLPGLDAFAEIIVFKGGQRDRALVATLEQLPPDKDPLVVAGLCERVVRIPTRIIPGQRLPFRPADVVLDDGDVVFVEARPAELFYTGGLLPTGEFVIPRDYDLDVVEAIAQVGGTLISGGGAIGLGAQPGLGNPSPSLLTVLRRTPGGGQVPIRVDLNRAVVDARERIPVRPGDVLILQETPGEAIARYFTQVFSFSYATRLINSENTTATAAVVAP
jgi:protein involved in polysaccharide export with SLBB domain